MDEADDEHKSRRSEETASANWLVMLTGRDIKGMLGSGCCFPRLGARHCILPWPSRGVSISPPHVLFMLSTFPHSKHSGPEMNIESQARFGRRLASHLDAFNVKTTSLPLSESSSTLFIKTSPSDVPAVKQATYNTAIARHVSVPSLETQAAAFCPGFLRDMQVIWTVQRLELQVLSTVNPPAWHAWISYVFLHKAQPKCYLAYPC